MTCAKVAAMPAVTGSGQRGFSLLELVLALVVLTLVAGVFAHRFRYLQEYAEKTAMEMTVMNMRTGLRYKVAGLMMENRMQELPLLLQENPINWLEKPPANYLGELINPANHEIPAGSWYFDGARRQLVYRLSLNSYFEGPRAGGSEIRFRVAGLTQKSNNGSIASGIVVGVKLEAVSEARWF